MVAGERVHRILPPDASARDAKQLEAEIRSSLGQKRPTIPGDPYLTTVMGWYLDHAKTLRSPETARYHALRCGPWVEGFRASQARQVAAKLVGDMRGHYAPATINRTLGALSKALRLAWEREATPHDYSGYVKRIADTARRDVVLQLADVKKLAEAASAPVRAAIWIALYTGCRRGEICAIRAEDIGADTITLRAGSTKTLKTRVIPITSALRPWLPHLPLAITAEGLKTGFRRARESAGMKHVTFHDLRRSCATLMIGAGVDLYVVSKLLGHSSVAVTQSRYAHLQVAAVAAGLETTFGITPAVTPVKRRKRASS
jgi:integrase